MNEPLGLMGRDGSRAVGERKGVEGTLCSGAGLFAPRPDAAFAVPRPPLVREAMLFHVVLAGEGLVALGANGVSVAGVLLGVSRCVAIGGEEVVAFFLLGERARILALLGAAAR